MEINETREETVTNRTPEETVIEAVSILQEENPVPQQKQHEQKEKKKKKEES